MSLASEANKKFNESIGITISDKTKKMFEWYMSEKQHGGRKPKSMRNVDEWPSSEETGEFANSSAGAMAKQLAKEQGGSYQDAMASLQYFENRWGTKATDADLKKIEATRAELRKMFDRDVDGNPKDKKNPKGIK